MFKFDFSLLATKFLILCCGLIWVSTGLAQDADPVDFQKSIVPILEKHCLECHGESDPEDFRIDVKDEAMDYIDEGSAESSKMYEVLISDDEDELMPPVDEDNPVPAADIALIKAWIDQGADWPENTTFVSAPAPDNDEENEAGDAQVDPKIQRIYNAVGSLHPAAVHLPIGLLLAAGLFALFSLRGNFVMSDCAYYCLWLGTLGAIAACVSGWWFSPMESQGTVKVLDDLWDDKQPVYWHRTSALIVTAVAFLLALFAAGARNRDPDDGVMWKLGLILLACGVGFVGHQGGELTYGKRHYDDLKAIGAEYLPAVFGDGEEAAAPPAKKEEPAVGDVSEE